MTLERMMELWLLTDNLRTIPTELLGEDTLPAEDGKKLNLKKMFDRFTELQSEFIAPYVIDNPLKGV